MPDTLRPVGRFRARALALAGLCAIGGALALALGAGDAAQPTATAAGAAHLVWSAEFDGPAGRQPSRAKWRYDIGGGGWGNHELQSYTSKRRNVRLDGRGHLVIAAHRETRRAFRPDPAPLHLGAPQDAGSVRVSLRAGGGSNEGPEGARPVARVLDARSEHPAGRLSAMWRDRRHGAPGPASAHGLWDGARSGPALDVGIGGQLTARRSLARGFHTYAAIWGPRKVRFRLDGRTYETVRRSALPRGNRWALDHRMFILLNLSVGGWPGPPNRSTHFPARLKVSWVRVWQSRG